MPKVSDAHRTARREEIIAAALRCFERKGYRGTSIADIIDEAGLSAGAIYGYFSGKQELFTVVASRVLEAREGELEARRAGGGPLSPAEVMATLINGIRREPFSGLIVQLWAEAAVDPEIRTLVAGVFARLRDSVAAQLTAWALANPDRVDGEAATWAERAAPVVLGVAPGFLVQRAIVEDFDQEGYLDGLAAALPR